MNHTIDRRRFLSAAATAVIVSPAPKRYPRAGALSRLVVGIMGTGGRGSHLAGLYQQQPNVEVAYVCDVDRNHAARAADLVARAGKGIAPKAVGDFREILDDKSVDILVVATPNHWHAAAAILACQAGKHVYVEKPCCHNPQEGEWMVAAARKYGRHVQMGAQRRSWPAVMEAIEHVRSGAIGRVYHAQAWYTNSRGSIGHGSSTPVPPALDYELWQGPAPRRTYKDNILPYNWHWFWHWGNGELGNNGVHYLDVCRWGLGVDYPTTVSSVGGRYRYQDDQETPDTNVVTFEFAGAKMIRWEGLSCNRLPAGRTPDICFVGENGSLEINGGGYTVYDSGGVQTKNVAGTGSDAVHITNFLETVRGDGRLNCEIAEGHKSTLLCHLGNISYRTGQTLKCGESGHILGAHKAQELWKRQYAAGWETALRS